MNTEPETTEIILQAAANHYGWLNPFAMPFLREWALEENTSAKFNPLATTQNWPGATAFNDNGGNPVKNYRTIEDGISALIQTLSYDFYPNVRAALSEGAIGHRRSDLVREIGSSWGTVDFAALIASGWNPEPDIIAVPVEVPETTPPVSLTLSALYDYCNALNAVLTKVIKTLDKETNLIYDYSTIDADSDPETFPLREVTNK